MTDERCTRADDGDLGCVRPAGHTGRHKTRENPDEVFGGGKPKLGAALKARKQQFVKPAEEARHKAAAAVEDGDKSDRIAALCEIATAMGMARVQIGECLSWINPQTGEAAMADGDARELWPSRIRPNEGDAPADAAPCSLMDILGVPAIALGDGGTLYASGGRMIVRTPSGALRPATLNVEPALGPAGDPGDRQ